MCTYACVSAKVKWCEDPAGLCVCVCVCLRACVCDVPGFVGVAVCRPLTSRTTGSIRQSWIHRRGREGLDGKSGEGSGVETGLIFWWRQGVGGVELKDWVDRGGVRAKMGLQHAD